MKNYAILLPIATKSLHTQARMDAKQLHKRVNVLY